MAIAGSLTYETKIDKNGFEKGLNSLTNSIKDGGTKIRNIVAALGIDKIISATMNTLKNSVDSAMKRIDTMNQFTRVMTTMTGSSEKAKWALEELKVTTKGTAYGLDVAAKSTQKFVTSGMELEKSTQQVKIWADAVAFYGDGTNETFANVTDALAQMVAKGKVEMDQLNRLTDAGIPAVQIYADMVGRSVADVQEDLSKGKISTTEFLDGLQKAFSEGTNKFASISGAAKEAGASWAGTFDNFKAAVTRGMVNIIEAIDKGLQSINLPTMKKMIAELGKKAESVLATIAKKIPTLLYNMKKTYEWVKKNQEVLKALLKIIASVTAGYLAYKATLIAIKAIQVVQSVLSTVTAFASLIPAIKSAKDAMLLLNMAFKANPVGLVIAGITALTAVIATSVTAVIKEKQLLGGLKEEVDKQKKSWEDLKKARQDTLSSAMTEIETYEKLVDELRQITDENGNVKQGYENRAQAILGILNQALGTEYTMTGNVISQYQELQSEIDKTIAAKKAEAVLSAYQAEYGEALKKQSEATETLIGLKQRLAEAAKKMASGSKLERAEASLQYNSIAREIKEQTQLIGEYGKTVEDYEDLQTASVTGSAEEIDKAVNNMGISYERAKQQHGLSIEQQIINQGEYVRCIKESLQEAKDNNEQYQAQVYENQLNANQKQLAALTESLVQQTSTITELTPEQVNAWKSVADQNFTEYSKRLSQLPPETQAKIQDATGVIAMDTGLVGATGEKGNQAVMLFGKNLKLNEVAIDKTIQAGTAMKNNTSVKEGAEELAGDANKGFNNKVDGNKWGEDLSGNISGGMTSQKSKTGIIGAAVSIATWIKENIGHSVPEKGPLKDELTYMPDMIDNLVYGIEKNRYKVVKATEHIAGDIRDSFNLEQLNNEIMQEMTKAVALETGSISATASVKSNNSMLNVIQANFNIDGSVDIDGQKAGKILAPNVSKTLRMAGVY